MKRSLHITYIMLTLVAISCNRLSVDISDTHPIYMSAVMQENIGNAVKSPYTAEIPSSSAPLAAKVLISTDPNSYSHTGQDGTLGPIGIHTNARFTSGESQLLNGALYNGDKSKQGDVYFSALHPQNDWTISNDGKKASYTFSGTQDVMFAPETIGRYASSTEKSNSQTPTLEFCHLLTYIKLYLYAASEEVAHAWGKVTSITIRNNSIDMGHGSKTVTIDLKTGNPEFVNQENYEASFYTETDTIFPEANGHTLSFPNAPPTENAYVLMAPVIAKAADLEDQNRLIPEFEIVITTENRSALVNIDLTNSIANTYYAGDTAGKQFSLTLKFTMGNTVAAQAMVTDWATGGIGIGDFEENLNP